jgi:hypothetical protein
LRTNLEIPFPLTNQDEGLITQISLPVLRISSIILYRIDIKIYKKIDHQKNPIKFSGHVTTQKSLES